MIKITFIAADGSARDLQCETNQSLMQAAVAGGITGIEADCGGMLTCATCHVMVREAPGGDLPPPDDEEQGMLAFTADAQTPRSRLSCQIWLTDALDGLVVDLPAHQH